MGIKIMPMTMMKDIVGTNCIECNKPATHYYANFPLCCQCYGGDILSEKETYEIHANWPVDPHYIHLEKLLSFGT
jgi:hypothetical protein